MPRFHHVNLGVPPDGVDAESTFLVDVLGYTPLQLDEGLRRMGARWFEAEDGSQIHLSTDPEHRPADKAHVAVEYGGALGEVEKRLEGAAVAFDASERPGFPRVVLCRDPAGNRWELRA
jgi:catechol 2,3-dioxygenase-like lactoylglutathione lyase family enzyme